MASLIASKKRLLEEDNHSGRRILRPRVPSSSRKISAQESVEGKLYESPLPDISDAESYMLDQSGDESFSELDDRSFFKPAFDDKDAAAFADGDDAGRDNISGNDTPSKKSGLRGKHIPDEPQFNDPSFQPAVFCAPNHQRPFALLLRAIIMLLVEWAQQDIPTDVNLQAMTPGFWHAFRNLDVDKWLHIFLKAVPEQVQSLFERDNWSYTDLLLLPSLYVAGKKQGVYGVFIKSEYREKERDMAYIGSTKVNFWYRLQQHFSRRYAHISLGKGMNGLSTYHRYFFREVQSNFRLLAAFDDYVEASYVYMLEGIFMVLFHCVFPWHGTHGTDASFNLFDHVCDSLKIQRRVFSLNSEWSISQHFPHPAYSQTSLCQNPDCPHMTYPTGKEPQGQKYRRLFDQTDPSKGFLCNRCYNYRRLKMGKLPNKDYISKWDNSKETLAAAKKLDDPICSSCGLPKSRIAGEMTTSVYFPGQLFCSTCATAIQRNGGRERTQAEVKKYVRYVTDKEAGEIRPCENEACKKTQKNFAPRSSSRPLWRPEANMTLCLTCINIWKSRGGKFKSTFEVLADKKKAEVQEKMKNDKPIKCCFCPKIAKVPTVSRFGVGPFCGNHHKCKQLAREENDRLKASVA